MAFALRWIVAAFLGFCGIWIIVCNYVCLFVWHSGRKHVSQVPFLGGVFLCASLLVCPTSGAASWAWMPLVVDPGCLLMALLLIHMAIITRGFRR